MANHMIRLAELEQGAQCKGLIIIYFNLEYLSNSELNCLSAPRHAA